MRKPRSGMVATVGLAILVTGSVALGATPIPVYETFEAYANGQNMHTTADWSTNTAGGSAVCQTTNVLENTKAVTTSLADLTLSVQSATGNTNVWAQLYCKPRLYDDTVPPAAPGSDVSAAFYVNTSSHVMAYDGNAWTDLGAISAGGWVAFAVHSDYVADKWDLFVSDDNTSGTVMQKLNTTLMDMNAACTNTQLSEMTIEGVATLDEVAIAHGAGTATASNLLVLTKQLVPGVNTDISLQAHAYSPMSAATLDGQLGTDLLMAMDDGDSVALWDTGQHIFSDDAFPGDDWDTTAANGMLLTAAYVNPGTGLWLKKPSGGDFVLFSDYDTLTTFTKSCLGQSAGGGGMNRLAWDKPGASQSAENGLGFAGVAANGDRLYLPARNGKMLYWSGSGWRDGRTGASDRLNSGEVFWYYRRAAGNGAWDIGAAQ